MIVQPHRKLLVTVRETCRLLFKHKASPFAFDRTHCSRDKHLARPHVNKKKEKETIFLPCPVCLLRNESVNKYYRLQNDENSTWWNKFMTFIRCMLQSWRKKIIMSINYTVTISINYTTPPPLMKSHFTPQMAGESEKLKHNFPDSIYTQYKHYIKLPTSTYRKFSWSMGTCIRIILTTINVLLCPDGIDITYPNCSWNMQAWISLGCCSMWVLSLPNDIGRGNRSTAFPYASGNEVGNKTYGLKDSLLCFGSVAYQNVMGLLGCMQGVKCLANMIPWLVIVCKGAYTTIVYAVVYKVA
jgi:hypothetical protein